MSSSADDRPTSRARAAGCDEAERSMPDLVDEVATAARTDPGEVVVEREWQGEAQRTPDTWLEGLIAGFARKGEYVEVSGRRGLRERPSWRP
jgi:hypothetical protein